MIATIRINGQPTTTEARALSYAEIARLVGIESPAITYHLPKTGARGELEPGDVIAVTDGLVLFAHEVVT